MWARKNRHSVLRRWLWIKDRQSGHGFFPMRFGEGFWTESCSEILKVAKIGARDILYLSAPQRQNIKKNYPVFRCCEERDRMEIRCENVAFGQRCNRHTSFCWILWVEARERCWAWRGGGVFWGDTERTKIRRRAGDFGMVDMMSDLCREHTVCHCTFVVPFERKKIFLA